MTQPIKVYQAISAVTKEMSQEGIAKGRKNQQQGYSFRGIDEVLNALSPMLAKHNLCVLPRMLSRELVERQTKNGGALFYVTVHAEFDFVSADDGSKHTVSTYGEAMDSADKATNKAMSAAYKYAAFQAFCIPTEGDNDADATTHEVAPKEKVDTSVEDKNRRPMPDDEYNEYSERINVAATIDDLAKVFKEAQDKARQYGDKPAVQGFARLKDLRKQELTTTEKE